MADIEKETIQEAAAPEAKENTASNQEKKPRKKMSAAAIKKFKYGGLATAITAVVVAIVVVLNLLVSMLVKKYPLKLDLTESAMYEISEDTIDYVKSLEQDVKFTVLMDESNFQTSGTYLKMVHEILQKYTQYSDKIDLTYVDPTKNPDVVNAFQANYSGTLVQGDVVISNAADATKMRVVNVDNMFTYDQEKYYYYSYYGYYTLEDCITAFTGEQDLTAALMYVTDADPVNVGVIALANGQPIFNANNHAYSLGMFEQTLRKNGYDITEIDLYGDALDPAVYDMLVLPAPVKDLTEDSIEKLSNFLFNDGNYGHNLIYFADISQSNTPNLDAFLASWGLQVEKTVAVESDEKAAQVVGLAMNGQKVQAGVPLASIVDQDYSANLANTSLPIPAPFCRPITLLWESKTSGITTALLQTSPSVYLRELGVDEAKDTDPDGAQTIMAVSQRRERNADGEMIKSNIMAIGSMMMSDVYIMQDTAYNNAEYLMSAINTMTGKGGGLIISQKDLTKSTIAIEQAQLNAVNIALYAIPFIVVVIGVVVFLRRKNR